MSAPQDEKTEPSSPSANGKAAFPSTSEEQQPAKLTMISQNVIEAPESRFVVSTYSVPYPVANGPPAPPPDASSKPPADIPSQTEKVVGRFAVTTVPVASEIALEVAAPSIENTTQTVGRFAVSTVTPAQTAKQIKPENIENGTAHPPSEPLAASISPLTNISNISDQKKVDPKPLQENGQAVGRFAVTTTVLSPTEQKIVEVPVLQEAGQTAGRFTVTTTDTGHKVTRTKTSSFKAVQFRTIDADSSENAAFGPSPTAAESSGPPPSTNGAPAAAVPAKKSRFQVTVTDIAPSPMLVDQEPKAPAQQPKAADAVGNVTSRTVTTNSNATTTTTTTTVLAPSLVGHNLPNVSTSHVQQVSQTLPVGSGVRHKVFKVTEAVDGSLPPSGPRYDGRKVEVMYVRGLFNVTDTPMDKRSDRDKKRRANSTAVPAPVGSTAASAATRGSEPGTASKTPVLTGTPPLPATTPAATARTTPAGPNATNTAATAESSSGPTSPTKPAFGPSPSPSAPVDSAAPVPAAPTVALHPSAPQSQQPPSPASRSAVPSVSTSETAPHGKVSLAPSVDTHFNPATSMSTVPAYTPSSHAQAPSPVPPFQPRDPTELPPSYASEPLPDLYGTMKVIQRQYVNMQTSQRTIIASLDECRRAWAPPREDQTSTLLNMMAQITASLASLTEDVHALKADMGALRSVLVATPRPETPQWLHSGLSRSNSIGQSVLHHSQTMPPSGSQPQGPTSNAGNSQQPYPPLTTPAVSVQQVVPQYAQPPASSLQPHSAPLAPAVATPQVSQLPAQPLLAPPSHIPQSVQGHPTLPPPSSQPLHGAQPLPAPPSVSQPTPHATAAQTTPPQFAQPQPQPQPQSQQPSQSQSLPLSHSQTPAQYAPPTPHTLHQQPPPVSSAAQQTTALLTHPSVLQPPAPAPLAPPAVTQPPTQGLLTFPPVHSHAPPGTATGPLAGLESLPVTVAFTQPLSAAGHSVPTMPGAEQFVAPLPGVTYYIAPTTPTPYGGVGYSGPLPYPGTSPYPVYMGPSGSYPAYFSLPQGSYYEGSTAAGPVLVHLPSSAAGTTVPHAASQPIPRTPAGLPPPSAHPAMSQPLPSGAAMHQYSQPHAVSQVPALNSLAQVLTGPVIASTAPTPLSPVTLSHTLQYSTAPHSSSSTPHPAHPPLLGPSLGLAQPTAGAPSALDAALSAVYHGLPGPSPGPPPLPNTSSGHNIALTQGSAISAPGGPSLTLPAQPPMYAAPYGSFVSGYPGQQPLGPGPGQYVQYTPQQVVGPGGYHTIHSLVQHPQAPMAHMQFVSQYPGVMGQGLPGGAGTGLNPGLQPMPGQFPQPLPGP